MKRKLKTLWKANAANPTPAGAQGTTCRNPYPNTCGLRVVRKGKKTYYKGWIV